MIRILAVALTYKQDPRGVSELIDPVEDVTYLQDMAKKHNCVEFTPLSEYEASEVNIIKMARDILSRCRPGDLFILYLAGHAYQQRITEQTTEYTFLAHHEGSGNIRSQDLLKLIFEACPKGVSVLQVRDTCAAAPNEKETWLLLSQGNDVLTMVLAACGTAESGMESALKFPHSVFLSKLAEAAKEFEDGMLANPLEVRKLVQSFFDKILLPIRGSRFLQTPVLAPVEHQSKVAPSVHAQALTYGTHCSVCQFCCSVDQKHTGAHIYGRYLNSITAAAKVALTRAATHVCVIPQQKTSFHLLYTSRPMYYQSLHCFKLVCLELEYQ